MRALRPVRPPRLHFHKSGSSACGYPSSQIRSVTSPPAAPSPGQRTSEFHLKDLGECGMIWNTFFLRGRSYWSS
ncbi:hypothetical protein Taro_039592 [Colocasia esculenta]|uniref:Uncharacterized protein n=1 Tax=Colocasia esculenta TaxID=4460 RepID=A0A843W6T5_COLES|nr:hypothetical protein [Colocasia esculenta]